MSELLLELFSEEIPARMQERAAEDLRSLVCARLKEAGCEHGEARSEATPRRLVVHVDGLPLQQPDVSEERKGPRVDAPEKAIEGFLGSVGLTIDQCEVREDKKGSFYVAVIEKTGGATADVIADIVPDVIARFPWPKSMRWGEGSLRWVRPLHSILCLFDGEVVPLEAGGIQSGNLTYGHRFHAPDPIEVTGFKHYCEQLKYARVMLEGETRRKAIASQAEKLAKAAGLELVEDEALLRENAGLAEWPVVLMGSFDEAFLNVPPEVLITSMKSHQKCFSLSDPQTGQLANRFILVSNLHAEDKGEAIVAGNERVIAARLSDARFFWDQDRKSTLESRLPELEQITFHARLGTQAERVARLEEISGEIAGLIGADVASARQAARLCKCDLVTEMVCEFPELQGLMGRYYALEENLPGDVADALAQHYQPQGPSDAAPEDTVAQAVALADKIDTLVGFWAIDEKPTGSKDPYALRRAALGVIRIVLEKGLRFRLSPVIQFALARLGPTLDRLNESGDRKAMVRSVHDSLLRGENYLLAFFADRLKVHLRDQGARHDLIDAVFALGGQDDLVLIVKRVEALGAFLNTDDGATLLAGVKRARNILRIEEKKDGARYDGAPDPELFSQAEEKALADAIEKVTAQAAGAAGAEDFERAMTEMATLRGPVDAFFDNVTVNAEAPDVRINRLKLLAKIRSATQTVADFGRIEG